jgi:hypothetical protein
MRRQGAFFNTIGQKQTLQNVQKPLVSKGEANVIEAATPQTQIETSINASTSKLHISWSRKGNAEGWR